MTSRKYGNRQPVRMIMNKSFYSMLTDWSTISIIDSSMTAILIHFHCSKQIYNLIFRWWFVRPNTKSYCTYSCSLYCYYVLYVTASHHIALYCIVLFCEKMFLFLKLNIFHEGKWAALPKPFNWNHLFLWWQLIVFYTRVDIGFIIDLVREAQ